MMGDALHWLKLPLAFWKNRKPVIAGTRDKNGVECAPNVIQDMNNILDEAKLANNGGPPTGPERGFVVYGTPGHYFFSPEIVAPPGATPCTLGVPPSMLNGAVAYIHLHPDGCAPVLSPLDIALANNNGIPVLAESSSGLYEYSPGQDAQVELSKNYDWTKPCPLPARPNKGVGQ